MKSKTSSSSLFSKSLSLSLSNIWRNKFLSLATVFVMAIIIFIFNVILAINFIAKDSISDLSKKIDIIVYLKETTGYSQSIEILEKIEKLEGVESVTYTSKNEALTKLKTTHPDLSIAFEKYNLGNPLPASLNITTVHPNYHKSVGSFLERNEYASAFSNVVKSDEGVLSSVTENLIKLSDFANQIIFWLIVTFIIGGTLIILNAIQITIHSRQKEISVMKLVGAPYWFIKSPFVIESIIYGLLAVVLSFIMLIVLSKQIAVPNTDISSLLKEVNKPMIVLAELGVTVIISIASSMIAVHEYLRTKKI